MSDKSFIYLIVGIVIAHFLFGVGYLIWKIYTAPKSDSNAENIEDNNHIQSENQ